MQVKLKKIKKGVKFVLHTGRQANSSNRDRNTHTLLWVIDSSFLENLRCDRDSGVDLAQKQ
jgi:hypothetical protein